MSGKLDCLRLYYEFFSKAFVFIKLLKFKSERRYFIYNFCSENDNIYVTKKTKIERKLKIHIIRLVGEGLIDIIPSFVSLFSILTPSYHMYSVSIS